MDQHSPARLEQLRFLERVQLQDLRRTRDWIATEERLIAAQARPAARAAASGVADRARGRPPAGPTAWTSDTGQA
ncbi:hypothetical protein GCM10010302_32320 [Streptomyces polychromogenes]|uniref:Uncharacterized protein n=1 Tax=Streptomyces polychromogenes TaxID=67342 RepID=A0ABP3F1H6_9ACTN